MPITTGFNHVATLTTDMDLTVGFYEHNVAAIVFDVGVYNAFGCFVVRLLFTHGWF